MQIKRPKQSRSKETLRRILDATETLLEKSSFDRLSIQEITRRAGVATGSFYTRFENKTAVLQVLFERYLEDTERIALDATEPSGLRRPLVERVRGMCDLLVHTFRARRGVSRAAQIHYLRFPEHVSAQMRKRLEGMYERIAKVILGDGKGIMHADPIWATRFALQMATAMCRAKILFTDHPVPDRAVVNDRRLIEELTRTLVGYLTMKGNW